MNARPWGWGAGFSLNGLQNHAETFRDEYAV